MVVPILPWKPSFWWKVFTVRMEYLEWLQVGRMYVGIGKMGKSTRLKR
jgi:hypothetical protein